MASKRKVSVSLDSEILEELGAEGEALSGQINKALIDEIARRHRGRLLGELLDSMDEHLGKVDESLISKYIDLLE